MRCCDGGKAGDLGVGRVGVVLVDDGAASFLHEQRPRQAFVGNQDLRLSVAGDVPQTESLDLADFDEPFGRLWPLDRLESAAAVLQVDLRRRIARLEQKIVAAITVEIGGEYDPRLLHAVHPRRSHSIANQDQPLYRIALTACR